LLRVLLAARNKERPHPSAQLRLTDADGLRLTAFATNTTGVPIAALELRHRQRACAEDRIRNARATDLRDLPLHDTAQNRIWLEIVQIALDLLAWMLMLALTGKSAGENPASPAPTLLHSRPDDHDRPPPTPEIRTPLALDRRNHQPSGTTRSSPEPRLTSTFPSRE
jgi:hypothetical protein